MRKSSTIPKFIKTYTKKFICMKSQGSIEYYILCQICKERLDINNKDQDYFTRVNKCEHYFCVDCLKNRLNIYDQEERFICPSCDQSQSNEDNRLTMERNKPNLDLNEYYEKFHGTLGHLNTLEPIYKENEQNLNRIEREIEIRYLKQIESLKREKENLLKQISQAKDENEEFKNLKNELTKNMQSLKNQAPLRHQYEFTSQNFDKFLSKPVKIIEAFQESNELLLGEILTREVDKQEVCGIASLSQQELIYPKLSLSVEPKTYITEDYSSKLAKWIECVKQRPTQEIFLTHQPKYIANYKNYLFVSNETGNMSIVEVNLLNGQLEEKKVFKLNFTNIRGLSANSTYLAASFSNLTKHDKNKISNEIKSPNGIVLFKYLPNQYYVCREFDRLLNLPSRGGFISPSSLMLNETFVLVADKELQGIFKLDLNTGNLLQKYMIIGKPYDFSVNSNFMIITDCSGHELNLVDYRTMRHIKSEKVAQANSYNKGPLNIQLNKDNFIFVKNCFSTEIYLFDINLKFYTKFGQDNDGIGLIFDLSLIESHSNSLVLACNDNFSNSKLVLYSF